MGDIPSDTRTGEAHVDSSAPRPEDTARGISKYEQHQESFRNEQNRRLQQHQASSHHAFSNQLDMTLPSTQSGVRPDPYNLTPIATSLPHAGFRPGQYPQGGQPRFSSGNPPAMMPQMAQYGVQMQVPMAGQGYYVQQPQMTTFYAGQVSPQQAASTIPPRQNVAYYPNQVMMNHPQQPYYYSPTAGYPASTHAIPNPLIAGQYVGASPMTNDPRATVRVVESIAVNSPPQLMKHWQDGQERRQSTVRGPPRKPKQSGHAIWIGNLPPQTSLMSLVHHVCKETEGLQSLFLISKSNCAFANYKDEVSCSTAQQKLHDSKFQTVRLVSRLRKSTVEGASGITAPTGPAIVASTSSSPTLQSESQDGNEENANSVTDQNPQVRKAPSNESAPQKDRFFILKSLTVEDLELSVRTGIWATQSHNEEALNNAFKSVDAVYLIFSANKSGEYFGYARMVSNINEDPAAAIEFAPKAQATSDLDLPKAISTDATEFAPRGRIIDDSARGTIFWEAEREDGDSFSDAESDVSSGKSTGMEDGPAQTWGKPFKLEWLSTARLPFYRTRGLRNPWNSNREVKIARDGTEIEPSVGRRLIGLFNRIPSPASVPAGMRVPGAVVPGFPQVRPYGR